MVAPTEQQREAPRERPRGRSPVMYQTWRDLLFLHWEIDPEAVQATLPPGLQVDTWNGRAYLGVVPFFMDDIRPRFVPPVPGISYFLEMNLRTYVFDELGVPGVWFYSLDANRRLAVWAARTFFHLPYWNALMSAARGDDGVIDYLCHRRGSPAESRSRFRYRGGDVLGTAARGTVEYFLVERYVLFAWDERRGTLQSGRVHHRAYPLQAADVSEHSARALSLAGFPDPGRPPDHAVFSPGVTVDIFAVERSVGLAERIQHR